MTTGTGGDMIEHAIGRDGVFVLRLDDGDARISGIDGERVTVRSTDGRPLDHVDVERGERSLTIGSRNDDHGPRGRRARRHADSGDLAIELPSGATVVVEAGSADIVAEHLFGDIRLTTSSGDLTLHDVGGSLTAEAVSGDIEIIAAGSLSATVRTVSGDLDLSAGTLPILRASTTSGDARISARFEGDGPFILETVSGDATLEPVGDLRIEFTTLTGDVHGRGIGNRSSADRAPIIVGSGKGPTVAFRSTSGDLAINPRPASDGQEPAPVPAVSSETPAQPDGGSDLEILRALERGEMDVEEAGRRLAALDDGEAKSIDD